MLTTWLASYKYTLIMARMSSAQNTPMYCVSTHQEKKQLLIMIRGTMEFADVITDAVGVYPLSTRPCHWLRSQQHTPGEAAAHTSALKVC